MIKVPRQKLVIEILLITAFVLSLSLGVSLGLALAGTQNAATRLSLGEHKPNLPTKILDIKDRPITEFFGDEKRELISITDVPQNLINALITREDQHFYTHHGIWLRGTLRAAWNIVTGQYFSGSSTITQQLPGALGLVDRTDISIKRKLVELWWAVQIERQYTKAEILEMYMNYMPFGGNTQGVEAASKFFFGHGVKDITLAESAMLVIQLARPGKSYNPIKYFDQAIKMQWYILQQMVKLKYCTLEEAKASYDDYIAHHDFTRSSSSTAYLDREDAAPYFSEYIRNQLEDMLTGSVDILRDGLVVHTTLDLDMQAVADKVMYAGIDDINEKYLETMGSNVSVANAQYLPLIDMVSAAFNIDGINYRQRSVRSKWKTTYEERLNPVVDLVSSMFGLEGAESVATAGYMAARNTAAKTQVQGALISLDSRKGYILAMVGGRGWNANDQFNRATSSEVMPGSSFKPIYYSAAIDSRKFTAATMLLDEQRIFTSPDGTPYVPQEYKGNYYGRVLLRDALANSMNIPSLEVLEGIGFDAAIQRASRMMGITDPGEIERRFPRYFPLGLGICRASPLLMARAYATFPNQGQEVDPISIRYIEDRNGKIILEPEKTVRAELARKGDAAQIMSPQTAYIMTSIMGTTLTAGTLAGIISPKELEERPMAAKTGTTENWSDIWTIGFSPQVTTAIWFGFTEGTRSLGSQISGGRNVGPIWASYMRQIHKALPPEKFTRPETGIVTVNISGSSGLLPTSYSKNVYPDIFLAGTAPKTFDEIDEYEAKRLQEIQDNLRGTQGGGILPDDTTGIQIPGLDLNTPDGGSSGQGNPFLD